MRNKYKTTKDNKSDKNWKLEVNRNKNSLCVRCGRPMKTTIFHDVPVCEDYPNCKEDGYFR